MATPWTPDADEWLRSHLDLPIYLIVPRYQEEAAKRFWPLRTELGIAARCRYLQHNTPVYSDSAPPSWTPDADRWIQAQGDIPLYLLEARYTEQARAHDWPPRSKNALASRQRMLRHNTPSHRFTRQFPKAVNDWLLTQPRLTNQDLQQRYQEEAERQGWPIISIDRLSKQWQRLTGEARYPGQDPIGVLCTHTGQYWPSIRAAAQDNPISGPGLTRALKRHGQWKSLVPIPKPQSP